MKKATRITAILLLLTMLLSLCACSTEKTGPTSYTIWLSKGEDSTYYSDYNENPAVKYWNSLQYMGQDGKPVSINVDFETGVTGEAESFFNTVIATWEDQYDVIDLSQGSYSAAQLYEEGVLIDLTTYIEAGYMPNYSAFLEANPTYAATATNLVDGEARYLQLYRYQEAIAPWSGWMYRRDWIVKYGTNPSTGEAFTGGYDADGNWSDDIIFPSWYNEELKNSYVSKFDPNWDGSVPVFISDWEWMLEIFATAIEKENLTDGYPMSIWYPGYHENGTIISGFGGGSAGIYKDGDTICFGGTGENFKTYLQCMNLWYENGWIDRIFNEHASDVFYSTDVTNTLRGNVGLFYNTDAYTCGKMEDDAFPATKGIYLDAAREPINDLYGSGEAGGQKYVPGVNEFIPDCYYQPTVVSTAYGLTTSLINNEKDIIALLSAIDYLYAPEEGALVVHAGLTAEQYATVAEDGDVYHRYGLAETGTYYAVTDGSSSFPYKAVDAVVEDSAMGVTCKLHNFLGLNPDVLDYHDPASAKIYYEWAFYKSTGQMDSSFISQLDSKDAKNYDSVNSNIRTYSFAEIPKFIMGKYNFDSDWETYCKQVKRYGYENSVNALQTLLNQLS